MKFRILHTSAGRMRIHLPARSLAPDKADRLQETLSELPGVRRACVFERTADIVLFYTCEEQELLSSLRRFSFKKGTEGDPKPSGRGLKREYEEKLVLRILRRGAGMMFLPAPVRAAVTAFRSIFYLKSGAACLLKGRLEVPVLDAAAVGTALVRGDYGTAGSIMFLLDIGSLLEEWTHRKSVDDLARTMSLNVDQAWVDRDGQEVLCPIDSIRAGDTVIVRTGSLIPLDGRVVSGEAGVNQASMTGESLPVRKEPGSYVYAGTVVEEGSLRIEVDKVAGTGRYDRVVLMIEESEKLKSASEAKAENLADRLVPWSFGATLLTYLLTGNANRAISTLMVDFSCALKLAMALAVLSAMREAGEHGILVKGGKFLEAVSEADTIVFDKTGTLTMAEPRVADVITFSGKDPDEVLRLAACLEEHYPHSIANAVVNAARERKLNHEERHAEVQYVVAHGIASAVDGEKVVIGSRHFVFEDEHVSCTEEDLKKLDAIPEQYSRLFLAAGGKLAAVICIEDRLRDEAKGVLKELKGLGVKRLVMLTGDNKKTAAAVAALAGVDEYRAEVLPEDKAGFVKEERASGHKVVMVGDGVNDSPALSEADAGIAISEGAAIAREIADITISEENLGTLVTLKRLSDGLQRRVDTNYKSILSFNFGLIIFGAFGILTPQASALLHNLSTLAIGTGSMTNLLKED